MASRAPFMPSGITVDAPQGYLDMCQRDSSLCAAPAAQQAQAAPAAPTPVTDGQPHLILADWSGPAATAAPQQPSEMSVVARMDLLNRINRYVNDNVRQRTDMDVYGVEEYWRPSGVGQGATGDCKDIAIEKRLELIQQGFPAQDLFYAVAFRSDIGLHAVLIAHTQEGDVVLDNRTPYILAWSAAPYVWVKRQSASDPSSWVLVNGPSTDAPDLHVAALDVRSVNGFVSVQAR